MANDTKSLVRKVEQVEVRRVVRFPEVIKKYIGRIYRENNGNTAPPRYIDYKA